MPLDPFITKGLVVTIAAAMYALALLNRRLSRGLILLSFTFLATGAPLGYDTLMYRYLIGSGALDQYGPLWSFLGLVANFLNAWWVVHLIGYVVIVYAFVSLSRLSAWPSLLLATITTLPGLGFGYLGLLRQALATAFVILFYLELRKSRKMTSLLFAVLAYLSHPAGLCAIAVLLLLHLKNKLWRIGLVIGTSVAGVYLISVVAPSFFDAQFNHAMFLIARYIVSDSTVDDSSGGKLYLAWVIILATPVLVAAITKRASWFSVDMVAVVIFLTAYWLLLMVSGSSVRLSWFFLPILMFRAVALLVTRPGRYVLLPVHAFFALTCFVASAYALAIAPEYFWAGDYPGIYFIQ